MSDNIVKFGFFLLNASVLVVYAWSLMIFTSLVHSIPWYEPSGVQFLAILVLSVPGLLLLGIALLLYGKWIGASILNRSLPFIGAILLFVITLAGGSLDSWMQVAGSVVCVALALLVAISTIRDLFHLKGPIEYKRIVT